MLAPLKPAGVPSGSEWPFETEINRAVQNLPLSKSPLGESKIMAPLANTMSQKTLKRTEKQCLLLLTKKKHKWRNDYGKEKPKDWEKNPEWQTKKKRKTQGARHLTAAALWGQTETAAIKQHTNTITPTQHKTRTVAYHLLGHILTLTHTHPWKTSPNRQVSGVCVREAGISFSFNSTTHTWDPLQMRMDWFHLPHC